MGFVLIKKNNLFKLGFPLIFIGMFLLPVGGYVLASNLNKFLNLKLEDLYFYIFTFFISGLILIYLYKILDNTLILFFSLTYFAIFYHFFITNYAKDFPQEILYAVLSLASIFFGASGLFLAQYFKEKKKYLYWLLSFFSINYLLAGGLTFNFFDSKGNFSGEKNIAWLIFFPIFSFVILNIGIRFKEILTKVFSIIYILIYVLIVLILYLDSKYYISTILIVLGIVLLGTGYYQYLKKMKEQKSLPTENRG